MVALELVAATRLGAAVVNAVVKAWLGDVPIAGDLVGRGLEATKGKLVDHFEQKRFERFIDSIADTVAARVVEFSNQQRPSLPENERAAAVSALADTFEASADLTTQAIKADLNAKTLERALQPASRKVLASAGLAEAAEALYDLALPEICAYAVQLIATLPAFPSQGITEILRRESAILESLSSVLARLPDRRAVEDFATDYRRQLVLRLDRMEIFGAQLSPGLRVYPLSLAYVSLTAQKTPALPNARADTVDLKTPNSNPTPPEAMGETFLDSSDAGPDSVDQVLGHVDRLLLTGQAGSGKTTLLRWVAVRCGRQDFPEALRDFNDYLPFYIRLREYTARKLPAPHDFLDLVGSNIIAEMSPGWVNRCLREGRAIVLIDGVDELPGNQRSEVREWLAGLTAAFPRCRYIVTSRPEAIASGWLRRDGFQSYSFESMSPPAIRNLVSRWHRAVAEESADELQREKIVRLEESLLRSFSRDRHLRRLAMNPLLCALLCALNRQFEAELPNSRMEIYEAALTMLLGQRDRERGVKTILSDFTRDEKLQMLQALAYWLTRNGRLEATEKQVVGRVNEVLPMLRRSDALPPVEDVTRDLIERSGILRTPTSGRVDFVHKTFQEYLAGSAAIQSDSVGELLQHSSDDQWREVIIMAAGHAQPWQSAALIDGLLEKSRSAPLGPIPLLVVACLETARQVSPTRRRTVEKLAGTFLPPPTMEIAATLAGVGDFVLDYLPQPTNSGDAAPSIRLAALIGGDEALDYLVGAASNATNRLVEREIIAAWDSFDSDVYARKVLSKLDLSGWLLTLDEAQLSASHALPTIRAVESNIADIKGVRQAKQSSFESLFLNADPIYFSRMSHNELHPLEQLGHKALPEAMAGRFEFLRAELSTLGLDAHRRRHSSLIDAIEFYQGSLAAAEEWASRVASLTELHALVLRGLPFACLNLVAPVPSVQSLGVDDWPLLSDLSGIEDWEHLRALQIRSGGVLHLTLDAITRVKRLEQLSIEAAPEASIILEPLLDYTPLAEIVVHPCRSVTWASARWSSGGATLHICEHQELEAPSSNAFRIIRDVPCSCSGYDGLRRAKVLNQSRTPNRAYGWRRDRSLVAGGSIINY